MIDIAHRFGVPVVLDGAQSVSHMPWMFAALEPISLCSQGIKFSLRRASVQCTASDRYWSNCRPGKAGGNMIKDVTFERTLYHPRR